MNYLKAMALVTVVVFATTLQAMPNGSYSCRGKAKEGQPDDYHVKVEELDGHTQVYSIIIRDRVLGETRTGMAVTTIDAAQKNFSVCQSPAAGSASTFCLVVSPGFKFSLKNIGNGESVNCTGDF